MKNIGVRRHEKYIVYPEIIIAFCSYYSKFDNEQNLGELGLM